MNKKLKDANLILENEIYTETKLSDVLFAFNTMLEKTRKSLSELTHKYQPALITHNFKLSDDLQKSFDGLYKILVTTSKEVLEHLDIEELTTVDEITGLSDANDE